jgi:RNA polymerase sigma-70 factor (ECF subfamily)
VADFLAQEGKIPLATLRQFRKGERTAFLEVYRAHAADVRHWVSRFFVSPFEQEEAVQEIWLTAHRMCGAYDYNRGPLRPWLRILSLNRCKEMVRAKGRRPVFEPPPDPESDLDEQFEVESPGPELSAQLNRLRGAVARFTASLTAEEAKVLQLGLVQEMTHKELAHALNTTVRRCKYLKRRILAKAIKDRELTAMLRELLREVG